MPQGILFPMGIPVTSLGCFWPKFEDGGEEAIQFWLEDIGIEPAPLKELRQNNRFKEFLALRMDIRRAIGVEGLLWALLIERLEKFNSFGSCKNCGRRIAGRKGKKYCGPKDNHQCYLKTQASRKRKSRPKNLIS